MTSFRPTILALATLILSTPAVMAHGDSHACLPGSSSQPGSCCARQSTGHRPDPHLSRGHDHDVETELDWRRVLRFSFLRGVFRKSSDRRRPVRVTIVGSLLKTCWIQPRRTTSTDRARRALKGLHMQSDAKRTCDLEDSREARIAVPAQCPVEALATQPGILRHL